MATQSTILCDNCGNAVDTLEDGSRVRLGYFSGRPSQDSPDAFDLCKSCHDAILAPMIEKMSNARTQ